MELTEIAKKIEALETRASTLGEQAAEAKDQSEIAGIKAIITDEIQPELAELKRDREDAIRAEEVKGLQGTVTTLKETLDGMKSGFPVGTESRNGVTEEENPYSANAASWFCDLKSITTPGLPASQQKEAGDRLAAAAGLYDAKAFGEGITVGDEGKALVEGTGSQGGYLVQTQIERQIIDVRELDNVLRPLCSTLNVTATTIELDQITLGTTAGWVAELAQKPESASLTLASITASIFTAAGLVTISNQLLQDSNPAVDQLATRDIAKRLVALEETAFLNGSGTGQPLGILNTPGLQTVTQTVAGVSATGGVLDSTLDAIANVQSLYGSPTAILMHPRTWTAILKDKNANGVYTYGAPSNATNNSPQLQQGRTIYDGPSRTLWGVPVVLTNRMPTNLGSGTNESRIIVGDFSEALILDRQGITVDNSSHVYFTSNQTVFRAEERVGFTAARQPNAFCVIGGAGLANS